MVDDLRASAEERDRLEEDEALAPSLIHEMRHPLMGAMAAMQFLEKSLGATVAGNEDWALLRGQLARLTELFASYQSFFHPEQMAPVPFSVQPVVAHAASLLGYRLRRCGKRFQLELPQASLEALGAPSALLHALTNLLLNALDALEEAGDHGRLTVRALASSQGSVQIRVSDEGTGIAPEAQAHLFERGFTTKPAGKGTGLGLAVARRMLGAFGGTLRLVPPDDAQRLGWARTEFCVELAPARRTDEGATAEPTPGPATPGARSAARILAVDDEAIIVLLLRKAFKQAGLDGVVVSDAGEAARLLQEERFDLFITDKNLPGSSGMELAALARRVVPEMGIILVTAYASVESADALFALGIDEYLAKPFEIDRLLERIGQVLDLRREGRPARAAPASARGLRVALVEHDPAFRARLREELERLGCQEVAHDDVLGAMRGVPPPDALIAPAALFGPEARQELARLRLAQPGLRVAAIGEPASLSDTIAAIGIGALVRLSRSMDAAGLAAALAVALRDRRVP